MIRPSDLEGLSAQEKAALAAMLDLNTVASAETLQDICFRDVRDTLSELVEHFPAATRVFNLR